MAPSPNSIDGCSGDRITRVIDMDTPLPKPAPVAPAPVNRDAFAFRERQRALERQYSCTRCAGRLQIVPGSTINFDTGDASLWCPQCDPRPPKGCCGADGAGHAQTCDLRDVYTEE